MKSYIRQFANGSWQARCFRDGKQVSLGSFSTRKKAEAAYKAAQNTRPKREQKVPDLCSVGGCTKRARAKGLCDLHYGRFKRTGSTELERRSLKERIVEDCRIDEATGCCIWRQQIQQQGRLYYKGKMILASRASWMVHVGDIPESQCVLHRCDNPRCVNPDHLFLGTQQDNIADMLAKERQARGSRQGHAKLSDEHVREIFFSADKQKVLARRYGISREIIYSIKARKKWKWLTESIGAPHK